MVIDIGAQSRQGVVAPVRLLLDVLWSESARSADKLLVLTDARVVGALRHFAGSLEDLLQEFETSDLLGFLILFGGGRLVSVYPPKCFGSVLEVWRIIGETEQRWDEILLDQLIGLAEIDYAIISQDETLDLEELHHVNNSNFPWGHWRLIAARVTLGRHQYDAKIDFSSKVAPLKREYGSLFTSISEALFNADPGHLNYEVNTDEYDPEVATIIPRLSSARSAEDVETILKEELLRWLPDIGVSTDNLASLAAEIWMLWCEFNTR